MQNITKAQTKGEEKPHSAIAFPYKDGIFALPRKVGKI